MSRDSRDRAHASTAEGEDEVAALYRMAGPPRELAEAEVESIREAARETWRAHNRRRAAGRRRVWLGAALAAGLAAALLVGLGRPTPAPAPLSVAGSIQRSVGQAQVTSSVGGVGGPAAVGTPVPVGSGLTTGGDGRLALALRSGGSLRLDHDSRVRIDSARSLVLEAGALYFDSGEGPASGMVVHTPLGVVTDVGTRFELRLLDAASPGGGARLRVRVRDGEVRVGAPAGHVRAGAGTDLMVAAGGSTRRGRLAPYGEAWSWAARTAPAPAIEGRRLVDFLDWAAHEMGTGWRLGEPRPAVPLEETILHGSVEGLTPEEALEVVLRGSGLEYRWAAGGDLVITAAGG